MYSNFKRVISKYTGIPYSGGDSKISTLLGMSASFYLGRFHEIESPLGHYFCSQLVARTFVDLGIMKNKHVDNYYLPQDFAPFGAMESEDLLIEPCNFGELINIW